VTTLGEKGGEKRIRRSNEDVQKRGKKRKYKGKKKKKYRASFRRSSS
jgi:hypothetical protein